MNAATTQPAEALNLRHIRHRDHPTNLSPAPHRTEE